MVAKVTPVNTGGGVNKTVAIRQDVTGIRAYHGAPLVQQTGTYGEVEITQEADTVDTVAEVIQSGDNKDAIVDQLGAGNGMTTFVIQNGNGYSERLRQLCAWYRSNQQR